jgi:hypothetical protein
VSYSLRVAVCECGFEIQIPAAIPLRKFPSRGSSNRDVEYINIACPRCDLVSRHISSTLIPRTFDGVDPYSPPSGTTWIGVWLGCDKESCGTHALVEMAVASGTSKSELKETVSRWKLRGITCYDGHETQPKHLWDSIPD